MKSPHPYGGGETANPAKSGAEFRQIPWGNGTEVDRVRPPRARPIRAFWPANVRLHEDESRRRRM